MKIGCIAFDLDDTLLDTRNLLYPSAVSRSVKSMIEAGLKASLADGIEMREKLFRSTPTGDIYLALAEHFGVHGKTSLPDVARLGQHSFYQSPIPSSLQVAPPVLQLLEDLKLKYKLYLVTSGDFDTQKKKIEATGLDRHFLQIFIVKNLMGEKKGHIFKKITDENQIPPHRCLSVGNRFDTDILEALEVGWKGCWLRQGEYKHLLPRSDARQPDFIIERLEELKHKCGL